MQLPEIIAVCCAAECSADLFRKLRPAAPPSGLVLCSPHHGYHGYVREGCSVLRATHNILHRSSFYRVCPPPRLPRLPRLHRVLPPLHCTAALLSFNRVHLSCHQLSSTAANRRPILSCNDQQSSFQRVLPQSRPRRALHPARPAPPPAVPVGAGH